MPATLRVGVGRCNITPPLGTLLMGYPDPYGKRGGERVRDPLNATALSFQSGNERAALVVCDVGIIDDIFVEQIRERAASRTGIRPDKITVAAIQTHCAPRTQLVWGWCDLDMDYIDKIMVPGAIDAIVKADAAKVPVRLGIGTTHSMVGVNRRQVMDNHGIGLGQNPWGCFDPEMTVLRFESAKGTLANLVHYGAHPTVLGPWDKVISRDWPGIMIDRVEGLTKATTLYVNGAVGDIAPRSNSLGAIGDGEVALLEVGGLAGLDAMRAWRSIKDFREVELATITHTFELPYRPLTPLDQARKNLAQWEPKKNDPGAPMAEYKHWQAVIEAHSKPPVSGRPFLQTITSLGPLALVPFPGEPFGETVMRMRHVSPFQYTLCASTTSGNNAYFCTRESLHRGGYEAWVGIALGPRLLAENIDDVLIDENRKLLDALMAKVRPPLPEA